MARRKTGDNRPYRLIHHGDGRAIDVVFAHIPGRRFSAHTTDDMVAIQWAEAQLRKGGIIGAKVPTVEEFASDFYTSRAEGSFWARNESNGRHYPESFYDRRNAFLRNHILPYFGKMKVTAITLVMVENWIGSMKRLEDGAPLSPASRLAAIVAFSDIMADAVRRQFRRDNPVAMAEKPQPKPVAPGRALNYDVQEVLFPNDPGKRVRIWHSTMYALYFSLVYDTGFRPGEALGLSLGDVYRTRNGLAVLTSHSVQWRTATLQDKVKTSGKGLEKRAGLLSDVTAELLQAYIQEAGITDADALLFPNRDGRPRRSTNMNVVFKAVLTENGFDPCKQYNLRHTFMTDRKMEVEDDVLSLAMGHKNGPRDDYHHRAVTRILNQLEENRSKLMHRRDEPEVLPFFKKVK